MGNYAEALAAVKAKMEADLAALPAALERLDSLITMLTNKIELEPETRTEADLLRDQSQTGKTELYDLPIQTRRIFVKGTK